MSNAYDGFGTTDLNAEDSASRIITDYKEQIESFPVADFDWFQYVRTFTSRTGGQVEITFRNRNGGTLPALAEGEEPQFTHARFTKLLVDVDEYAEKPAVTRILMEDSRFDEIREALAESTERLTHTYITKFLDAIRNGVYGTSDIPEDYANRTWASASAHLYAADHDGTSVNQSQAGHNYNTGASTVFLGDIHLMQRHLRHHGFRGTEIWVGEAVLQQLQDLAAFTQVQVVSPPAEELQVLGEIRGQIAGVKIIVSPWMDEDEMIMIDKPARPVAYVNRRSPTVETMESDFGLMIRAISARFGFKMMWKGAAVRVKVTA